MKDERGARAPKILVDESAVARVVEAGERWLKSLLATTGQRRLVIGVSGGIDSAVVSMWAARAVGPEALTLLAMPYGLEAPSAGPPSARDSLEDGRRVFEAVRGADARVLDIAPSVDLEARALGVLDGGVEAALADPARRLALGNLKARIRAVRLRTIANLERGLVLGTENLSENMLGYFTLGGDEQSDAELIANLLKTEVRAVARAVGVPAPILEKPPSADLWSGQTDEGELGMSYDDADRVIAAMLRGGDAGVSDDAHAAVKQRIEASAFKRAAKPAFQPEGETADGGTR